jgi:hypothetical protein
MAMTTLIKASKIQKYNTKRKRYTRNAAIIFGTLGAPWPKFRPSSIYKSLPQLDYLVPEAAITCHDLSMCVDVVLSTSASCLGISTLPGVSQANVTRCYWSCHFHSEGHGLKRKSTLCLCRKFAGRQLGRADVNLLSIYTSAIYEGSDRQPPATFTPEETVPVEQKNESLSR